MSAKTYNIGSPNCGSGGGGEGGGAFWSACQVSTTSNINLAAGGLLVVDGYQTVATDRVLVKNQTDPSQNGIYVASAGPWLRSTDADNDSEFTNGKTVFAENGDLCGGCTHAYIGPDNPNVDVDPIQFSLKSKTVIPDGSIGTDQLADGSVTTIKIDDGAVTVDKLDPGVLSQIQAYFYENVPLTSTYTQQLVSVPSGKRAIVTRALVDVDVAADAGATISIGDQSGGATSIVGDTTFNTQSTLHQPQDVSVLSATPDGSNIQFNVAHNGATSGSCKLYIECRFIDA